MKKKILVVGPVLSQTGYGEQCRFALRGLMTRQDIFDVFVQPVPWGKSSWIPLNSQERRWIDALVRKTAFHAENKGTFDVSFQVTIPNEWKKIAPINIGYTAGIETTRVSPEWIEKSKIMDKIIVVSNHSKNVYLDTSYQAKIGNSEKTVQFKCDTPIDVVNYGVRKYEEQKINIDFKYDFNFLIMAQWGPRKNVENTVRWWLEEFKDEEIGLVLKTNLIKTSIIDRHHTISRLNSLLNDYKDAKCNVYLIHGNLKPEELTSLYRHPKIKCLASLTHGEGFGLPMFEAAYNGVPIIAPDWSGHKDFLYAPKKIKKKGKTTKKMSSHFTKVGYELKPIQKEVVWKGVLMEGSLWCYPKKDSYKSKLREVYTNYNRAVNQANALQKYLIKNFKEEDKYKEMADSVKDACGFEVDNEIDAMFKKAQQQA